MSTTCHRIKFNSHKFACLNKKNNQLENVVEIEHSHYQVIQQSLRNG